MSGAVAAEPTDGPADQLRETVEYLLPAYAAALERSALVVALGLWWRLPAALLLPFHIYIERPNELGPPGLHPRFLVAPLTSADDDWMSLPLYQPKIAREARRPIRLALQATGTTSASRTPSDWERAFVLRPAGIPLTCPARSMLAIDIVHSDGTLDRGSRPYVGRHAPRKGLRDRVVGIRRGPFTSAAKAAAPADMVFLNIQGVRGRRTRSLIRDLLDHFKEYPGVLIASSPSDLFELSDGA